MNENTEAQTNISPDYPLNFLLAVDNKYRTYYIPADIDETIEYLLHIIFSNTPNDADILRKHFKYGKTYADIACEYQDTYSNSPTALSGNSSIPLVLTVWEWVFLK